MSRKGGRIKGRTKNKLEHVRLAELPLQNRQHAIQEKEKDNTAGKEGEENGNKE